MVFSRRWLCLQGCYRKTKLFCGPWLAVALALSMSACSGTGDWSDYNYGPADWLAERNYGKWDTMYSYEKFAEPEIKVHYVDDLTQFCGSIHTLGCARFGDSTCVIWIGKTAPSGTLEHEKRHCHGWRHPQREANLPYYSGTSKNGRSSIVTIWYPMEQFL